MEQPESSNIASLGGGDWGGGSRHLSPLTLGEVVPDIVCCTRTPRSTSRVRRACPGHSLPSLSSSTSQSRFRLQLRRAASDLHGMANGISEISAFFCPSFLLCLFQNLSLSSFSLFACAVDGDTRPDEVVDSFQPDSPAGQHQPRLSTACLSFPRIWESRQLLRHTPVPIDLHLHSAILQDLNQRRLKEEEKQVLGPLAISSGAFDWRERERAHAEPKTRRRAGGTGRWHGEGDTRFLF